MPPSYCEPMAAFQSQRSPWRVASTPANPSPPGFDIVSRFPPAALFRNWAIQISRNRPAACEILGLDPLYVANEGKLLAWVPEDDAEWVLSAMRRHPAGKDAAIIGEVVAADAGLVTIRTRVGGSRILGMPSGEQLPRIC